MSKINEHIRTLENDELKGFEVDNIYIYFTYFLTLVSQNRTIFIF